MAISNTDQPDAVITTRKENNDQPFPHIGSSKFKVTNQMHLILRLPLCMHSQNINSSDSNARINEQ